MATGRLEPRKTIGSIDTSEFLVAVAASVGFILGIGSQGVNYSWVVALLVGGIIAAPIAAWLVRHIPARVLGATVGGFIILLNVRTLLRSDWIDASAAASTALYIAITLLWAAAISYSYKEYRKNRSAEQLILAEAEALAPRA
jgi:hypothetical protein